MTPLEDRTVPTTVTIAAIADATEGGSAGTIRLTRDGNTSQQLVAFVMYTGTATPVSDISFPPSQVVFAANSATADVTITPVNDTTSEPTETATLTIQANGSVYTIGSPSSATVHIFDNDPQLVSVASLGNTTEGAATAFQFTRIGDLTSSLTANYTVGGTATSGTDFTALSGTVTFAANSATANVSVAALADNVVESSETVTATVASGTGYTPSGSAATVTIADDPPVISISGDDVSEASSAGGFLLTRSGGDLSGSLTVTYSVSGTATSGTDYTALSGTVTFDADAETAFVGFDTVGDNTADDGETIIATLTGAGSTYTIDSLSDDATITIADQTLTVWVERLADGTEGGSNGTFRFWRGGDITSSLTVNYTVGGTATSGTDYTALSGSVTFAANSDHTDVTVSVTNDATVETTETVTVTLDSSDDYLLSNDSDTLFINDNDSTKVYWVSGSATGYSTDWNTAANWSTNSVPTSTDDVNFDSAHSVVDCTNFGDGASSRTFAGLHLGTGYSGTVTLAVPVTVGTFEETSGTLDEPSGTYGSDLTVTNSMTWTGGTLNSTSHVATVTITGSTAVALFAPASEGTVSLGSNLTFDDGARATMKAGSLTITNADSEISINDYCSVIIDPEQGKKYTIDTDADPLLVGQWNLAKATSYLTVTSGNFSGVLPLKMTAGTFSLRNDTGAYFGGQVDRQKNAPSFKQSGGVTTLAVGSRLAVSPVYGGMALTGGTLNIEPGQESQEDEAVWAKIYAINLEISGGDITFHDPAFLPGGGGDHRGFGEFRVSGDIRWTGGTFHPYVDAESNDSNIWIIDGKLSIGGTATIVPTAIDYENSVVTPDSNSQWSMIEATAIGAGNNTPSLDASWSIVKDTDHNPAEWWELKKL